jgi:hypothetical protein
LKFAIKRKVTRKKMNEGIERGHGVGFKGLTVYFRGYEAERERHVDILSQFTEGPSC